MSGEAENNWHLSKTIPISIILGMVVQVAALVWWGGQIESRVSVAERDIGRVERQQEAALRVAQSQAESLATIRAEISGLRGDMNRLIRVVERGAGP